MNLPSSLTSTELAQMLRELNVSPPKYDRHSLFNDINSAISSIAEAERKQLPQSGLFHNWGNRSPFVRLLVDKLGSINLTKEGKKESTILRIDTGHCRIEIEVYENSVIISSDWGFSFSIGLHSDFYDEVIRLFFDEDRGLYWLFKKYSLMKRELRTYSMKYSTLKEPILFENALKDPTAYKDFKNTYSNFLESIRGLEEYLLISNWDSFFRKHAVCRLIFKIVDIRSTLRSKRRDPDKFQEIYDNAFTKLKNANTYGMLSDEEKKLLVPWSEFIHSVAGENADVYLSEDSYRHSLPMFFKRKIKECEESGTYYMRKKKKKMEADLELCKTLKSQTGLDCFIDRSHFSAYVDHFNIIMEGDMVWVFRIDRGTPSQDLCIQYFGIVKKLDEISKVLGKKVTLKRETTGSSKWNLIKMIIK